LDGYKKADKVGRFIFANKWALSEVDAIFIIMPVQPLCSWRIKKK
jgi:hypothetical protein